MGIEQGPTGLELVLARNETDAFYALVSFMGALGDPEENPALLIRNHQCATPANQQLTPSSRLSELIYRHHISMLYEEPPAAVNGDTTGTIPPLD